MNEELMKEHQAIAEAATARRLEGDSPDWQREAKYREMEKLSLGERASAALSLNSIYRFGREAKLAVDDLITPNDPTFNGEAELRKRTGEIDPSMYGMAMRSGSQQDFDKVVEESDDLKLKRAMAEATGFSTSMSNLVAQSLDVDTLVLAAVAPAGVLGKSAQIAKRFGRVPGVVYGTASGAATGATAMGINELANRTVDMGYEAQDLPQLLMTGLMFGSGIGALGGAWMSKTEKMGAEATRKMFKDAKLKEQAPMAYTERSQWAEHKAEFQDPTLAAELDTTLPKEPAKPDLSLPTDEEAQPKENKSLSAGASRGYGLFGRQYNPATSKLSLQSEKWLEDNGVDFLEPTKAEGKSRWINKFQAATDTVLRTDFMKLINSKSPTAMAFAMNWMEDSAGTFRAVNRTAAVEKHIREANLRSYTATMKSEYKNWAKEQNISSWGANMNAANEEAFNRAFAEEMDARFYHDAPSKDTPVGRAADAIDEMLNKALRDMQDSGVHGAENVEWKSGWIPQRWSGSNYISIIDSGQVTADDIATTMAREYLKMYPGLAAKEARAIAHAVLNRARNNFVGTDTSITGLLQQDGRAILHKGLVDNGLSEHEAANLIDALGPDISDRKKVRILKQRMSLDTSARIGQSDFTIRDLLNNNYMQILDGYATTAAGSASAARILGLRSADEWSKHVSAIKDEMLVNSGGLGMIKDGSTTQADGEWLGGLYSAFIGAQQNAAMPTIRRMQQVSNMVLLNQLGIPQLADMANIIAANGIEAWWSGMKDWHALRKNPALAKRMEADFADLGNPLVGEHNLWGTGNNPDYVSGTLREHMALMNEDKGYYQFVQEFLRDGGKLDFILAKGQRLQGFISGFYKVKEWEQILHDRSFIHSLNRHFQGSRKISSERLKDMGFTQENMKAVRENWESYVTRDPEGILHLNLELWDNEAFGTLGAVTTRTRNQNVQLGMFGEGMSWIDPNVRSTLLNLRNFTLLSYTKQLLRTARIADKASAAAVAYGLGLGSALWAFRQEINGNGDKVTPLNAAKGALNYAGLTSSIPMFTDPILGILGLEQYSTGLFSPAGRGFGGYNIIPNMAPIDTANKLYQAPGSLISIAGGNYNANDISAVQAATIFGNAYFVNGMFNYWKRENKVKQQAMKREEKRQQKADAKAAKQDADPVDEPKPENINPVNALDEFQKTN